MTNLRRFKKSRLGYTRSVLMGVFTLAFAVCRAEPIELTDDRTIRAVGTYTYYAGQTDGIPSFFTTKFYPGSDTLESGAPSDKDGNLDISIGAAEAISIESGDLTDRALNWSPRLDTNVTGWNGNTSYTGNSSSAQPGFIDIVFDLGAVYKDISLVIVNYADSPGHRFDPTSETQIALYGASPPDNSEFGGLTQFATASAVPDTKAGNMIFAASSPFSARYIVVRLTMLVSGNGIASMGGYINSIRIQATSAP